MNEPILLSRQGRRQRGLSMVELMVAITIALFIALGLSLLYVNMKSAFNSQNQMAQVQDAERLAVTMLTTTVQSAAYFPNPVANTRAVALPANATANADGTTFAAGQGITGTGAQGSSTSHTIDVRFQSASGDGLMNCQGQTNTSGSTLVWINSFTVDANNELECSVNGNTPVVLVNNVAKMTVLYGVDVNADGYADSYLDAATISTGNLWASVRSAQVTLTFVNPLASQTGGSATLPTPWVQTIALQNML
ncbi:MAG: PilW family protein [Proteobacteria bacterium]|nr:PilW family protein [Pseudomonadota bacterium]